MTDLKNYEARTRRIQRTEYQRFHGFVGPLEKDRRRDVRMRLSQAMTLEIALETSQTVILENLTLGGVGLTGAPAPWVRDKAVGFTLRHKGEHLWVDGRVIWRRMQTVGNLFLQRRPDQDRQVYRFCRRFLGRD